MSVSIETNSPEPATTACLSTARLTLRPPRLEDAAEIYARYATDPEVTRFLSWTTHRSVDETKEFLRKTSENGLPDKPTQWLVRARDNGRVLGMIGWGKKGCRIEFGYCFARDAWGQGFATEAVEAIVQAAFADPEVMRIQAFVDVENRASARVLEKAGFTREGLLRRYMLLPNLSDAPRDVLLFALVRE